MTLCISLKTKSGIVLASDSRISYESLPSEDTATKLYFVNEQCGVLVSGRASFHVDDDELLIDSLLDDFIQNMKGSSLDIDETSKELSKFMSNELQLFKKENDWNKVFIVSGYNEDTYETRSHRIVSINEDFNEAIDTGLAVAGMHPSVRLLNSLINPEKYQQKNPEKYHNEAAIERATEIARGRTGIRLKKLDDLISRDQTTMRQGASYCRLMISAVSEFKETVGGEIDIATIKPGKGFRWKTNHHKKKTANRLLR